MIDNRTVGKCIARLRVAKGMTQQGLAAALNVSHQAVSKWETGAALPDMQTFYSMSKLFGTTMEQILTGEAGEEDRPSIRRRILGAFSGVNGRGMDSRQGEGTAADAPGEEAPLQAGGETAPGEAAEGMTEENQKTRAEASSGKTGHEEETGGMPEAEEKGAQSAEESIGSRVTRALEGLGPMIDEAVNMASGALENAGKAVASVVRRNKPAEDVNLSRIKKLAPFMSKNALDQLVWHCCERVDWDSVCALAPFVSRETLDELCESQAGRVDYAVIQRLAPFLSRASLEKLIQKADGRVDWDMVQKLAPFLERETVDRLALQLAFGEEEKPESSEPVEVPKPFGGKQSVLRSALRKALEEGNAAWAAEHMGALNALLQEAAEEEKEQVLLAVAQNRALLEEVQWDDLSAEDALLLWQKALESGNAAQIDASELLEILSPEQARTAMWAALACDAAGQLDLCEWVEHMDSAGAVELAEELIARGMVDEAIEAAGHLNGDGLARIALRMAEKGLWEALEDFYADLDETTLAALAEQAAAQSRWDAIDAIGECLGD